MTPKQKIELRRSEIRKRLGEIAALEGDALTDEIGTERDGLMTELRASESQLQAAIQSEETETRQRGDQVTEDGEAAALRALETRASIAAIYAAVLEHRATSGAEAELQQHLDLATNQIPLALIRGRIEGRAIEDRAVTPAPAAVGTQQAAIIPGVFPMACGAFLGVDMPTVAVGEATYPVLSTNAAPGAPAKGAPQAETTGAFSAEALGPKRLQASFFYAREDRARFMGMDEALRMNLSDALADALDEQILTGPGGLFTGANLTDHNVNAVTSFALYRSGLAYGRVDGTYAGSVADLRIVMGSATYGHAAAQFRSDNAGDRAALEDLESVTAGVKVSSHVPAVNANKQNAIVRLGMRRDAVCPVWEGVTLIPDEVTKAATGEIVVTAVMMHNFKIVRPAGFYKQQTQHA